MKIRLITAAVSAVLAAWAPIGMARQTVALPYIFGANPGDSVGQAYGLDTTGGALLTIHNNININSLNDVGGGITSNNNNTASLLFLGNSTITRYTGTSVIRFLDITAGANATAVNFNGDVFTTQIHHTGTGTINFNGHVNNGIVAASYIFGGDGFLNIGAGKLFNSALTTTAGDNTGTLTLNAGSSMIGAIGATSAGLKLINLVGGNAALTGAVFARSFNLGANRLTMTGALTTNAAGTIATTFSSNAVFGNIVVNGASNINAGGITVITKVRGILTSGTTYRIVSAPSGTSGAPISVINSSPRYTFIGSPTSSGTTSLGNVDIVLTSITPLISLVTSPDAVVLAPVLDINASIDSDLGVILDAVTDLPDASAINSALVQFAPANTNLAAPLIAAQATQLISDTWLARLDEIQTMCCDTTCDAGNKKTMSASQAECKSAQPQSGWWLKGVGKLGNQEDANNKNGYKTKAIGAMMGRDVAVNTLTRVGLGAGYVRSDIKGRHTDNQTNIDSYHLTAYFNYAPEAFFVQGAVTGGIDRYHGTRNIVYPGISRQASSDVTGQQYTAIINAGKHFRVNALTMTPLVGLQASHLYVKSYTERGGGGHQSVGRQSKVLLFAIDGRCKG